VFADNIFDESTLVIRVLSLFYMVYYEYKLDLAYIPRDIAGGGAGFNTPQPYTQQLWSLIPTRYLLVVY
jgi:hypothetical protein